MRKSILLILFFASFFTAEINASHIVGGEFQIQYTGKGYLYNVYLNLYFDDINAQTGLLESDLTIYPRVFNKTNNAFVKDVTLKRTSSGFINYTNNGCNDPGILRTRMMHYEGMLDMSGFTNPQGYYIAWERCCRNYQTLNIVHQDIYGNIISGQAFYLEFPPVSYGTTRFINSSPSFTVAPAQYLCQDNFTLIDFSATDSDGDSLVYSMTTPLQGHAALGADPINPSSAPYPLITFKSGYTATNAIHGNPALTINPATGIMSLDPSELGLYAFAIKCEEYRSGVKIGEVRRDFQYLIKSCPISYPPSVGLNASNNGNSNTGNTDWDNLNPDTLVIKLNRDTCYTIFVTDSSSFHGIPDFVNISYGKTNLPKSSFAFTPARVQITPTADTATMKMCFTPCDKVLIEQDSIFYLDIIVTDGKEGDCPRRTDTLRTYVYIDVEDTNNPPVIGTTLGPGNTTTSYPDTLTSFYVYGTDVDPNDIRVIDAKGFQFDMDTYGMQFNKVYEDSDSIAYLFTWIPTCDILDKRKVFRIDFTLKDKSCIYTHYATTRVTLRLEDIDRGLQNIKPANLITANGDSLNDCFYLPNLPKDNCTYEFKSVQILNRWGAQVYYSTDRNFKWCPDNVLDGVYYYTIDLNAKHVKSWIQVIR